MNFLQSLQNPQVKAWKKLTTKKGRDQSGLFLAEGFHLVEEALKKEGTVKELIVRERVELPDHFYTSDIEVTTVTDEISEAISETEHSQGIFAVCKQTAQDFSAEKNGRFLLIDAVQDPGNIGTMIRTADAAGIDAVILGKGSADPYNAKVLRSAQGSHFHLPIVKMDLQEAINELKKQRIPFYGTALEGAETYHSAPSESPFALLLGNEGAGVSMEWLSQTDKNLFIPLYGKSESLNVAVAAGILLYHLRG
ncbi:TrmH family RNA methyltransferase [Jeotgalibacillus proteolyticus]|uniref:RNA methyltransferase n=1 Tax=Jeotgalibacillus proteolyticus TaxID=2082395 RepID=A0A2S5GFE3_9BACL|nr:RNA methyltransferase [Jeotgalibacillus proteolyticus]PPA71593.1 RNA methyltransferase [Jeotgalibacillus proteolyticus]